jgi:hypothetical protein
MIERVRSVANGHNARAPSRSFIFGPAPILPGEDAAAYDELLMRVSSSLKPTDIIDEFFLRDVVDHYWQIIRLRQVRESLIDSRLEYLVEVHLRSVEDLDEDHVKALIRDWRAGKPSAVRRIKEALSMVNSTLETARAQAFADKLDQLERIDRLLTVAEGRCSVALRELERRRTGFAQTFREKIHQLDDVELKEVEAGPLAPNNAAIKGPR